MKITLMPEKCIACGLCHLYADTVFDYNDDGIVKFYDTDKNYQSFENNNGLLKAITNCPTRAIISDNHTK